MGRLKFSIAYLSGSMDEAQDGGVRWRKIVTPKLHELGVGVFDPCDKATQHIEDSHFREDIQALKNKGDFNEVRNRMKPIVGEDYRCVHLSSFLYLYIDKTIFMFGTPCEVTWAVQQRKPIIVVCKQGKRNIPNFLYGKTPHEMFFDTFEESFDYLKLVDEGKTGDMRRWHFFDYNKVYGIKNESS